MFDALVSSFVGLGCSRLRMTAQKVRPAGVLRLHIR